MIKNIILASKSPRRKSLLRQLGLKFVVVPSKIEEKLNPRLKPRGQAEALSREKCEAVLEKYKNRRDEDKIVLAADTLVAIDEEVLGKPSDGREAKRMLRKLSGRFHSVITGFTIGDIKTGRMVTKSVETIVYFRKLSEREIKSYAEREKLSDKAGAYAIQGVGAILIEKIEGDYFNVVGLPLNVLAGELRRFGVEAI